MTLSPIFLSVHILLFALALTEGLSIFLQLAPKRRLEVASTDGGF